MRKVLDIERLLRRPDKSGLLAMTQACRRCEQSEAILRRSRDTAIAQELFASSQLICSEESLISDYESCPFRPFGYFGTAQYKCAAGKLFCSELKAVFAQGDSSEIVSKRGFTNSGAMRKYLFNRGKNAKSEMGRAIKKERPGRGQIS